MKRVRTIFTPHWMSYISRNQRLRTCRNSTFTSIRSGTFTGMGKSRSFDEVGLFNEFVLNSDVDGLHQEKQLRHHVLSSDSIRNLSSEASIDRNYDGPTGELFESRAQLGLGLVGQTGSIHRTFGPRDNSEAILATGGEALAAHASFDPDYKRAQGWIRQHAVGTAVLSPLLLQGLTGALTQAAFPEGVLVSQSMTQFKPLIVGVAVKAKIEVIEIEHSPRCISEVGNEKNGYLLHLKSKVSSVRDDELIVEGTKLIWIPDYENM
jgi:hypothetical protein